MRFDNHVCPVCERAFKMGVFEIETYGVACPSCSRELPRHYVEGKRRYRFGMAGIFVFADTKVCLSYDMEWEKAIEDYVDTLDLYVHHRFADRFIEVVGECDEDKRSEIREEVKASFLRAFETDTIRFDDWIARRLF